MRCTEPSGYAHTGGEAAFAVLTACWTGRPQRVDLSMQECVDVANMASPARFDQSGFRGRRLGAHIGRTREIWPTKDGWVSFGLRGGKARIPSLEIITKAVADDGIDASALEAQDWAEWSPAHAPDEVLRAVEGPIGEYFSRHTMQELYDLACETNLMLAPANSPREILGSVQLAARGFFAPLGDVEQFPVVVRAGPVPRRRSRPRGRALPCPCPRRARSRSRHRIPERATCRRTGRPDGSPGAPDGTASRSSSSVRARPVRSRRATSWSTARPCCASSHEPGPTSCASTPSGPTTRTASKARRCTTASTWASATSR